jgi:hypothetical protein
MPNLKWLGARTLSAAAWRFSISAPHNVAATASAAMPAAEDPINGGVSQRPGDDADQQGPPVEDHLVQDHGGPGRRLDA